ncbi:glycoside hydrolase family 3 protein [Corynebacterium sp. zg254]|uniref:beta-N-acetylhexosaminidase n=1 Tax=Corynebacterium zhongnanshanii TaxID=2768834 RepID=A0ABQ6VCZ9_9CORY|nr:MULTISPECIES: glycoside hydrolase family 3 N-terminal domain-containing protein [Corynebacterium]KAB3519968.1 glycoside hydrolase family 3 protein [Corynebacterium zhongnanshanii]MCR5914917.1 glycoside hydrolase family 3 protein [Corynebacterium sp. zg254]
MRPRFAVVLSTVLASSALVLSSCSSSDDDVATSRDGNANASNTAAATPYPPADPGTIEDVANRAAGKMIATPITDWDSAVAAVDAGVRHLFVGTGSDFSILNGQGSPEKSIAALQERAGEPLTVSVDEEGGIVQRLADIVGELPSAQEMAEKHSADEVRNMMRTHGEKIKKLGITVDFAPVVDLASGASAEENAIGSRSFSADPAVVVEYARAYAEGLQQAGITPVIKHFPGHGHATGDSHKGSVTVPPLPQLEQQDLVPFAQLVSIPGVQVMVGHMLVPELGTPEEQQLPASINPAVYHLLRTGGYSAAAGNPAPGFGGLIITDDLSGMAAVADSYSPEESTVAALVAGADQALAASGEVNVAQVVDAVRAAIIDGRISREHAQAAIDRSAEQAPNNSGDNPAR